MSFGHISSNCLLQIYVGSIPVCTHDLFLCKIPKQIIHKLSLSCSCLKLQMDERNKNRTNHRILRKPGLTFARLQGLI